MLVTLMLLHSSGLTVAFHKLTHSHNNQPTQALQHTNHGCSIPADSSPDQEKQPNPDPTDESCSICLGLSGLQLIADFHTPEVVEFSTPIIEVVGSELAAHISKSSADHPARAPPVC
jgi:hypothetical protein